MLLIFFFGPKAWCQISTTFFGRLCGWSLYSTTIHVLPASGLQPCCPNVFLLLSKSQGLAWPSQLQFSWDKNMQVRYWMFIGPVLRKVLVSHCFFIHIGSGLKNTMVKGQSRRTLGAIDIEWKIILFPPIHHVQVACGCEVLLTTMSTLRRFALSPTWCHVAHVLFVLVRYAMQNCVMLRRVCLWTSPAQLLFLAEYHGDDNETEWQLPFVWQAVAFQSTSSRMDNHVLVILCEFSYLSG